MYKGLKLVEAAQLVFFFNVVVVCNVKFEKCGGIVTNVQNERQQLELRVL